MTGVTMLKSIGLSMFALGVACTILSVSFVNPGRRYLACVRGSFQRPRASRRGWMSFVTVTVMQTGTGLATIVGSNSQSRIARNQRLRYHLRGRGRAVSLYLPEI
jgi:hypothetical protein